MYDLVIRKRKLNKLKVILVIAIIVAVVFASITGYKVIKMSKAKKNAETYGLWAEGVTTEEENAERVKYEPLTATELENFNLIYSHQEVKRVFLTFDDGPSTTVTPYILDLLQQEDIKATFFVLGMRVDANPELVKREYEEGHYVANHGYSHRYEEVYSSAEAVLEEYNKTNTAIQNAIGNSNYNSLVFRFPGGSSGGEYNDLKQEAKALLKENGIASVDWNALTNDAAGATTKEEILSSFYSTIEGKTSIVILMHDAADKILTYECLSEIITYLKDNGYEFKTMYDLLER